MLEISTDRQYLNKRSTHIYTRNDSLQNNTSVKRVNCSKNSIRSATSPINILCVKSWSLGPSNTWIPLSMSACQDKSINYNLIIIKKRSMFYHFT